MTRLRSVYLVTRDMDRAEQFFRRLLGADPAFRDGDRWAEFASGDARVALSSPEEAADPGASVVALFEVADLESAAELIITHGGTVGVRRDMGSHGATLAFRDPDGNLCQLYAKSARA